LLPELKVILTSMVPILEMKVGIPVGVGLGLPIWYATLLSIFGTCLQIPFNLFLIRGLTWLAERLSLANRFLLWSRARSEKHRDMINRWGTFGVAILVGIPIPGTGLWTGTVAGSLIGLNLWRITAGLVVGTIMAGVIVGLAVAGVVSLI
jgi:uncharacterized membrane protein